MALCFEAGGRLGDQVFSLLDLLAQHAHCTGAERDAFLNYARQRLHIMNLVGVARVIRAHEPICDGPCVINLRGTLDLGIPAPRPAGTAVTRASDLAPAWLHICRPPPVNGLYDSHPRPWCKWAPVSVGTSCWRRTCASCGFSNFELWHS
jgi:hypothetical protein